MVQALTEFEPIGRSETLAFRVGDQLRHAIMRGRFRPGDKLTLRALAKSLDVSMTPAREALFNLVAEGVLEMRQNGSVYIPVMDEPKIKELIKVRLALEGLAAAVATPKLRSKEIAEIELLHEHLIAASREGRFSTLVELNWRFHFLIYGASDMPFLLRMIESCWLRAGSYVNLIYPDFAQTDDGVQGHAAIVAAIKAGEPAEVSLCIQRDIEMSSLAFLAAVKR